MDADLVPIRVWTIGHSTRSIEEFIGLLQKHSIEAVVDVRMFPGSRRYPQFNEHALADALGAAGIEYHHAPKLGGRRKARADSLNTAWRNEAFRGYADYMETEGFREGIAELIAVAVRKRTAVMCAEAVWWQCHRSLIADWVKSTGGDVQHIIGGAKTETHPYTKAARIVAGKLSYRSDDQSELALS